PTPRGELVELQLLGTSGRSGGHDERSGCGLRCSGLGCRSSGCIRNGAFGVPDGPKSISLSSQSENLTATRQRLATGELVFADALPFTAFQRGDELAAPVAEGDEAGREIGELLPVAL